MAQKEPRLKRQTVDIKTYYKRNLQTQHQHPHLLPIFSFSYRPHLLYPSILLLKLAGVLTSTMSFLGGAECSTAGNPLSQFTKHVQDDKSLQRDRLVGRGPGGLQEGLRSQRIGGGQDKVCSYHQSVGFRLHGARTASTLVKQ